MSNMSYCAYENTLNELRQCLAMLYEARDEGMSLTQFLESRSSKHEKLAVTQLVACAEELLEVYNMMEDEDTGED